MAAHRWSAWVCQLALVLVAVLVNASEIQQFHNSDTVLVSFVSIDHWLPFYWDDNRYGMPLPLLASFIKDYQLNLLFQTQLTVFAAFAVVCFINSFFLYEPALIRSRLTVARLNRY